MGEESDPARGVSLRWPIWIGVVCEELERQRHFYRDVLGLSELKAGDGWVWFDFGGKLLELVAKTRVRRPELDRPVCFGFEVDDIRVARAELISRGVEPVTEIAGGSQWRQYWAYFKDAEGKLFEIVQSASD